MTKYIRQQAEELGDSLDDDPADHEDPDEDGFLSEDFPNIRWIARLDSGVEIQVMAWNIMEAAEEAHALCEVEYPDCYVTGIREG